MFKNRKKDLVGKKSCCITNWWMWYLMISRNVSSRTDSWAYSDYNFYSSFLVFLLSLPFHLYTFNGFWILFALLAVGHLSLLKYDLNILIPDTWGKEKKTSGYCFWVGLLIQVCGFVCIWVPDPLWADQLWVEGYCSTGRGA